jgi:uncharacterized membrane protein YhaH (DUF805 family)
MWNASEWYEKALYGIALFIWLVVLASSIRGVTNSEQPGAIAMVCVLPGFFTFLALINTVLPVYVARMAREKGHPGYSKFIIVLTFLGIGMIALGLSIVGVIQMVMSPGAKCSHCKSVLPIGFKLGDSCPQCGMKLTKFGMRWPGQI